MQLGAHLPLIDFNGRGYDNRLIGSFTDAAREIGFTALASNDHITFQRPWLDGIVALSSIIERGGDMLLATTVSLPVVRGPAALAKAAAAIDILSGGRLLLGVGPGSSARDYQVVGHPFEERWSRLDESVRVLRSHLKGSVPPFEGRFYNTAAELEPRPSRPDGPPIWIGSWGSEVGATPSPPGRWLACLGHSNLTLSGGQMEPVRKRDARPPQKLSPRNTRRSSFRCVARII
jgi:alkanesulfonate monooxygenase SsuD/methylene tetrahydromethanopterin reductase-like flavin-dependent oxidoreductase (luciferase family)